MKELDGVPSSCTCSKCRHTTSRVNLIRVHSRSFAAHFRSPTPSRRVKPAPAPRMAPPDPSQPPPRPTPRPVPSHRIQHVLTARRLIPTMPPDELPQRPAIHPHPRHHPRHDNPRRSTIYDIATTSHPPQHTAHRLRFSDPTACGLARPLLHIGRMQPVSDSRASSYVGLHRSLPLAHQHRLHRDARALRDVLAARDRGRPVHRRHRRPRLRRPRCPRFRRRSGPRCRCRCRRASRRLGGCRGGPRRRRTQLRRCTRDVRRPRPPPHPSAAAARASPRSASSTSATCPS